MTEFKKKLGMDCLRYSTKLHNGFSTRSMTLRNRDTLFCWKKTYSLQPANHSEYEMFCTVEITSCRVFSQYEEKAMTDVNPGSYFTFSTNPQRVKEELWADVGWLS